MHKYTARALSSRPYPGMPSAKGGQSFDDRELTDTLI